MGDFFIWEMNPKWENEGDSLKGKMNPVSLIISGVIFQSAAKTNGFHKIFHWVYSTSKQDIVQLLLLNHIIRQ